MQLSLLQGSILRRMPKCIHRHVSYIIYIAWLYSLNILKSFYTLIQERSICTLLSIPVAYNG